MNKLYLPNPKLYGLVKSVLNIDSKHRVKIKVHGFSMSPFIKHGSIVSIKPFSRMYHIHFGDIIGVTYPNKDRVLIHRVIGLNKNQVLLKGDNNLSNDGWFSIKNIIGIVDVVHGKGINKKNNKLINYLIAYISKTGLLNRILLPILRSIKKKKNQHD
ncbi:MAG: signal peptidase I [Pseudomonadota bacterium]